MTVIVERCAECKAPLVAAAVPGPVVDRDAPLEAKPRPRALLGVSIVVDYGPSVDGRTGGEMPLCFRCGGSPGTPAAGQPAAPAAEPAPPAAKPRKPRAPAQVATPRPAMVADPVAKPPSAAELAAARGAISPGKR